MAEKKGGGGGGDPIIENFLNAIIEYWFFIVVIILGFLVWRFGLVKEVFALAGTALLGWIAWKMWVHYIQQDFISGMDFVLLEIVPPREVLRSPKAMELFITNALFHWSMKGGKEEYWQGAVWFWFSLEIASIDGVVHFYIRTPTRLRGLIETQMYAQYPQAQIKAVEDYTLGVDEITPEGLWNGWGCEFGLTRPEAFPIRTYIDYGLDKDPKEEFKVDPVSATVELFGALKKGEQMWMQVVITPSKKTWHTAGTWFGEHDWVKESRFEMERWLKPYTRVQTGIDGGTAKEIRPPDAYKNALAAMNAKTSKLGFETGIRVMYLARKEVYDMSSRRNLRLIFRQYAKPDCNEFTRINSAQGDALNSSILTLSSKQVMILANRMLHEYRERGFFHLPMRHHIFSIHIFEQIFPKPIIHAIAMTIIKKFFLPYQHPKTYVLNTEELATIWHFPGQIMRVPTLERIESKEASPPTNLPV